MEIFWQSLVPHACLLVKLILPDQVELPLPSMHGQEHGWGGEGLGFPAAGSKEQKQNCYSGRLEARRRGCHICQCLRGGCQKDVPSGLRDGWPSLQEGIFALRQCWINRQGIPFEIIIIGVESKPYIERERYSWVSFSCIWCCTYLRYIYICYV